MRFSTGSLGRLLVGAALLAAVGLGGTAIAGSSAMAPAVVITSGPPESTMQGEATFEFRVDNAPSVASTFECSVDGAQPKTCTSPFTVTGLAAGSHKFEVTLASDPNPVKASSSWSWSILAAPRPRLEKVTAKAPDKPRPIPSFKVTAMVKNSGTGDAENVAVCLGAPKRWIVGKAKRCEVIKLIPVGKTGRAKFDLKVKKKRFSGIKPLKLELTTALGESSIGDPPPKPTILGMAINEKGMCGERCRAELKKIPKGGATHK